MKEAGREWREGLLHRRIDESVNFLGCLSVGEGDRESPRKWEIESLPNTDAAGEVTLDQKKLQSTIAR